MSDHASSDRAETVEELRSEPGLPAGVQTTETYRTDDGTVFYDAENPLAWIQTDGPVTLKDWA